MTIYHRPGHRAYRFNPNGPKGPRWESQYQRADGMGLSGTWGWTQWLESHSEASGIALLTSEGFAPVDALPSAEQ